MLGGVLLVGAQGAVYFWAGRTPWAALVGTAIAASLAFGATLAASVRVEEPRIRVTWRLWTAAAGLWLAGALVRIGATVAESEPGLATADVLWWLAAPLAALGLLLRSHLRPSWAVLALDTVPIVALITAAAMVARGLPLDPEPPELVSVLYPALYASILATTLHLAVMPAFRASGTWWLATAGLCLVGATALLRTPDSLSNGPAAGHPFDVLWSGGMLLLALAGVRRALDPAGFGGTPLFETGFELQPLLPLLALLGLAALPLVTPDTAHAALYLLLLAAGSATVVRITVSRRATARLLMTLQRARDALAASERRHRSVFESAGIGSVVVGLNGRIVEVNDAFAAMLGYEQTALRGRAIGELTHPEDLQDTLAGIRALTSGAQDSLQTEKRYLRKDGGMIWGRVSASAVRDEHGAPQFLVALIEDVTERRIAELRFHDLLDSAPDAMVIADADGTIVLVNTQTEEVFGYQRGELIGRPVEVLVPERFRSGHSAHRAGYVTDPRVRPMGAGRDLVGLHKDGHEIPVEISLSPLATDEGVLVSAAIRDVTDRRRLEQELRQQAFHDSLTGLANRALFANRAGHALARGRRRQGSVALLLIDVDDFKSINDTLGHQTGDRLLVLIAERLRRCTRSEDTCARLGGDEFAVLLDSAGGVDEGARMAERILESLEAPFPLAGQEIVVRSSIGVAFGTPGDVDADDLLRNADIAMYEAKRAGGHRYSLFEPDMLSKLRERRGLIAELEGALERDEFVLHYQPIVRLETGATVGVEALVRWDHPRRGLLAPSEFILVAEDTGLIVELTRCVLRKASTQTRRWQLADPDGAPLSVSVNISGVSITDSAIVGDVARALEESGLPPQSLTLELTETALVGDLAGAATLRDLEALGVRLAIDDFGAGHSSLRYLRSFPIDALKIDRSFISRMTDDPREASFVETIVDLATVLDLETVAEGIETREQRDLLAELGCTFGQGYYFARPIDAAAMEALLLEERFGTQPRARVAGL